MALPGEIWTDILDYMDPVDIVSTQRVNSQLLKLARDSSLWRYKCFQRAPSAVHFQASRPDALSTLTGALGGLSLGEAVSPSAAAADVPSTQQEATRASNRARAVVEWDGTHVSERIDWYSEYIARHATLSTDWAECNPRSQEVKGMAVFDNGEKVITPMDDGSICVWDIKGSLGTRRKFKQLAKGKPGMLFQDASSNASSSRGSIRSLGTAVDNISIDSKRLRAYVSVENCVNEVDLTTMEVVAQNKYAWHITALSQDKGNHAYNLTIGTSFSLHIHDSRLQLGSPSIQQDGDTRVDRVEEDDHIAFLPNYSKDYERPEPSTESMFYDHPHTLRSRMREVAHVEPGPQSILHRGQNEIIIAGRMPSILFYDRRSFPQLQSALHSGARLSAITTLPIPPSKASAQAGMNSTLIACGEYGGRGSLEIYEVPQPAPFNSDTLRSSTDLTTPSSSILSASYSYKNRQEASSSKLLSVAIQGSRIVFSDADGMLKWVERDGRGLARRWNINAYNVTSHGASITGEQVVRKMIALPETDSERGTRGDGDLLVWTGERIGIVTTKPRVWEQVGHDELVQAFEEKMNLDDRDENGSVIEQEEGYARMMRQALERQADERRWVSRFGVRRF